MIRTATAADIPRMLELADAMHAESRFSLLRFSRAKTGALIEGLIDNPDGLALVAERCGQVIGGFIGFVTPHFCSDDLAAYDFGLFIAPQYRGSRAGFALLKAYAEWANAKGALQINAGITTGVALDASTRLFQAAGFAHVGHLFEFQGN